MSYLNTTFYRYFPADSATHYTAIQTGNDESILQVKPSPKKAFASLADWLATIPGNPTETDLHMSESYALHNVDPSWNVPLHNVTRVCNMQWSTYLYRVLMQFNSRLKHNVEMRNAFNRLVEVLEEYKNIAITNIWHNYSDKSYHFILMPESISSSEKDAWKLLPVRFYSNLRYVPFETEASEHFAPQIYEAYKPLYDLMEKVGFLAFVRSARAKKEKEIYQKHLFAAERVLRKIQQKKKNLEAKETNHLAYMHRLKEHIEKTN